RDPRDIGSTKSRILQRMEGEIPSIITQLGENFQINLESLLKLDSNENDSLMNILTNELSGMMDIHHFFRGTNGVKDVIIQPATGLEDARSKVDCYVLVTYEKRRGAEQYAVQMKRRHFKVVGREENEQHVLVETGDVIPSNYRTGLFYREYGEDSRWWGRFLTPNGAGKEQPFSDELQDFLSIINDDKSIPLHGSDSPYFIGIDANDVVCYTAWWVCLQEKISSNRR
ncbi:MAG: hypothetical protein N3A54_06705, partial [Patescibacteria group bacterium]|nr:hypothetical protein [Patescibacteria group bacterium]